MIQIQTPVVDNSLSRQTDVKTEKIHKFSPVMGGGSMIFNSGQGASSQSRIQFNHVVDVQGHNASNQSS